MKIEFSLLRNGITATSVQMDILPMNALRRWIASSIRLSGKDFNKYHFVAYSDIVDVSGTDILEELTGSLTGTTFAIINKREMTGSHMEYDIEPYGQI